MTRRRFRLPVGYAALKPDLGQVLRAARRRLGEKQLATAHAVGLSREGLSRVESGRSTPRPETMDRLMAHLDLDWDQVADKGPSGTFRRFNSSGRGERAFLTGARIRTGRRRLGLTLRELAAACGLSAAQLSRIERGEVVGGRILSWPPAEAGLAPHDRSVLIAHPLLELIATAGKADPVRDAS